MAKFKHILHHGMNFYPDLVHEQTMLNRSFQVNQKILRCNIMRQCKMNILGTQSDKSHTGIQCILLPARKYPPALPLFCREVCNTTNHINKCKKKKKGNCNSKSIKISIKK